MIALIVQTIGNIIPEALMDFNLGWLNETANKDRRNTAPITTGRVEFVVWHGTDSPNPANTPATLNWALVKDGRRGAANYYIPQAGIPYWYIDEAEWIAYHSGAGNSQARGYKGYQVNVHAIGVEIEERLTTKPVIPATDTSLRVAAELALHLKNKWGIPLDRAYHVGHKEIVTPGYRYDPGTYSIDQILGAAKAMEAIVGNPTYVDPRFIGAWQASGGIWQRNELTPGYPIGSPFNYKDKVHQLFERGCARLDPGNLTSWLLLSEIEQMKKDLGK